MTVNVKLKRSAVPGKVPLASSLELGELALNTHDGCLYLKRDGVSGIDVIKFCGTSVTDQFITRDEFTGNGTLLNFTLSITPQFEEYVFVTINGVTQQDDAYSISGNVLTFSEAPLSTDSIEVRTFSQTVSSVSLRDYQRYVYKPTTPTSTFTGLDIYGNTLAYDLDKVEVYVNGVRLVAMDDFTASNGTSVVTGVTYSTGATIEIVSLSKASFVEANGLSSNAVAFTTTTASQIVDTFNAANYRTAKYIVSISHATLGYHSTEILVVHDGVDAHILEYGTIFTQNSLATFSASIVSGVVRLTATLINTNTTIKLQRITVAA